jgi:hypothetical protein
MVYRICPVIGRDCACSDAEAAPCLSKLIEDYLDELRDQVLGIDPDGGVTLSFRRRDIAQLGQSFRTHAELRADWENHTGLKWGKT